MRRHMDAVVLPDIPLNGSTTVHRRTPLRRLGAAARRDEGATALEFAIVLPVVLSVVFFALYGAMYFFYGAVADHVARTVVREVSIPVTGNSNYPDIDCQSGSTCTAVTADANSAAGSLLPNPSSAVPTWNPDNGQPPQQGDLVTVTVTYKLPLLDQLASVIPGLSAIDTMTRSASERRQ
ncbi:MAG TPA: TadE/TadG family type IV pilus assembly protein [Mycobacteriales bacterium]|nr:TadE/TadG family type IV pilus assembly protein [Mycobacteriales bacterium]